MTVQELVQQEIYSDESLLDGSIQEYRLDIERACLKYTLQSLEKHIINIPEHAALAKSEVQKEIDLIKQQLN